MHTNKFSIWIVILSLGFLFSCEDNAVAPSDNTGRGGSLTRFAISQNYLYVVNHSQITVYDISQNKFSLLKTIPVDFGLETIQARAPYLYLGANDAMYIYSIADPESPQFIFRYAHIVSCDPVVVQGNRAYVTLKSSLTNNTCNRGINSLEIIDISNPDNPTLITTYGMTSPGGLAIDGNCLFVCEGENGLKMFDVTNDIVTPVKSIDIHAYDVIAYNAMLTLTGKDGVFQYTYNCSNSSLNLVSKIPVDREAL